jgi:hypothetical protein
MTLVRDQFDGVAAQFASHGMAISRTRFEDRAGQRLARLNDIASMTAPRVAPNLAAPARIGGVGAAWRKAN